LEKQNIRLELTDAAKKLLAKEGYDPAYGARPLKRVIQREILDPLSLDILDGKFGEGDRIVADAQGAAGPGETDHLVFRKA
jgi:ATP-dependent Clp protease ATP-binding subunit ClpA